MTATNLTDLFSVVVVVGLFVLGLVVWDGVWFLVKTRRK